MRFMEYNKRLKKYENCILAFAVMAVNVIVMAACFDLYYDLNDDTMMKDIMSGVYSGVPEGRNMQTLYPLGALIALCYKLCRQIPWYGLFLCLCQFGCLYLVGVRLCEVADRQGRADRRNVACGKILFLLLLTFFQWGICLLHLINIQYTITCAIMSATAIFLFLTVPDGMDIQQFVVKNIPAIILVIVSYQLRTEMLLLTFPFICLAGLYCITEEKKIFVKDTLHKYGAVLGIILAGMALSSAADDAAYGTDDWKDFRDFFDARTTVYDFYRELITDEEYSGALTELGVSAAQQTLLENYNFGLDDGIDTQMLTDMADYASHTLGGTKDLTAIAKEQISYYRYRTFHRQDAPYNIIVIWAYLAVAAAGVLICRRYAFVWQLVLLLAVRSAVWMFILMRGRDPVRITHSLYLVEFAFLSALLIRMLCQCGVNTKKNGALIGMTALLILLMAGSMTNSIPEVKGDQALRDRVNEDWYRIDAYCRERPYHFYFEDVYSTVDFSQKIFKCVDNGYANYDIFGGWMCKSPLYREKLLRSGIVSASEALIGQEHVYLIMSDVEESTRGTGWIVEYYSSQGVKVTVEEADRIGEHYLVYRVCEE